MSDRRRWGLEERARERASRQAEALRETFPGSHRGEGLPTSPTGRTARSAVPPVSFGQQPPYGHAIHVVTASGQVFDGGGTACEWTGVLAGIRGSGFDEVAFPTDRLPIPLLAYFRLDLTGAWQDHTGGGRVQIVRNGVVLHDDQEPFGSTYGPATFALGVCDPEEDDIQVIVSPVGQAGAQPDGQTGRWEAALVLVEKPVNVREDETVTPWAWYRSDDIAHVGDGNDVDEWPDRTGGGRHLIPAGSGTFLTTFEANVLDGHGGLTAPHAWDYKSLQATFTGDLYPLPDGLTVVQVQRNADGWGMKFIVGMSTLFGAQLFADGFEFEWLVQSFSGMGSTGIVDGDGWQGLVGTMGPDVVRGWSNGDELSPDIFEITEDASEWASVTSEWIEIDPDGDTNHCVEFIVFDGVLDPDVDLVDLGEGPQTIHAYLHGRYPSLGVS